ncbi:MAG: 4-alpha-glucanotransferase [Firmicutes bacterium]|nr:4-alpha-glucanotransferase [Bacillota bacterium]
MLIYHNSQDLNYRRPFGAAAVSSKLSLTLEAAGAASCLLRLWSDDTGETLLPMESAEGAEGIFTAEFQLPDAAGLLWYYFIVTDAEGTVSYYGNREDGLVGEGRVYDHEPPSYQITVYKPQPVPQWYKDALVYQIFPDRFHRGADWRQRVADASFAEDRKGQKQVIQENWNDTPFYTRDETGAVTRWPFFGGTLEGVREKLDYLRSLGMTAIYFNPIFKATSNHRYDTADYMQIDPMFGDEDTFRSFCKEAEQRGISVILDGVFSHTGADSLYFDKYGNYGGHGAYTDKESPYADWYRFTPEGPQEYECWWGVTDLPNVEELAPSYKDFICGEKGVVRHWLAAGARGWRLDVADELPDEFIADLRSALKAEKPDGVLIGEVWEDASNKQSYGVTRRYFSGDELDAVMNYPLREMLLDYVLGRCTAETLCRRMRSLQENYPEENFYGNFNLISGHDRTRVLTVLGEAPELHSELAKEHYRMPAEARKLALRRLKLLSALQYASPGVPCTYYGDEAGMEGYADPFNRGPYPWGREDQDLLEHYRILGQLYQEHPVLKNGSYEPFFTKNDLYGFLRKNDNETILVLANPSKKDALFTADCGFCDAGDAASPAKSSAPWALELLTSKELPVEDGILTITVPSCTAMMILLQKEAPKREPLDRSAGILCHISSLPGGKLGKGAEAFVDYLASAGMKLWQVLPLNPTGLGASPYLSPAVFAGNPDLIDAGTAAEADPEAYKAFCKENAYWLEDYALYCGLKAKFKDAPWQDWPEDARDRTDLAKYRRSCKKTMDAVKQQQFLFWQQWDSLRAYANGKGIKLIGDLPIYVAPDSVDTWAHREAFQLDEQGHLKKRAGVPPDYFTPEGQDWGNPLYDWDALKADGYDWWIRRMQFCAKHYDTVRLDHFRSFSAYYAISAGKTAKEGQWQPGAGMDFFRALKDALAGDPALQKASGSDASAPMGIIAEDLGALDAGVYNLLKEAALPGMNVWQFNAFEMAAMTEKEASGRIFYSGTHDNQTLLGWCRDTFPGKDAAEEAAAIVKKLYESHSPWVILQLQDLLGLGDEARMNVPGTPEGNWTWQAEAEALTAEKAAAFRKLAESSNRL